MKKKVLCTAFIMMSLVFNQAQAGFIFEKGVKASAETKHIFTADTSNGDGQVGTTETKANVQYEFKWDRMPLDFTLGYKNLVIEENLALDLPSEVHGYYFSLGAKVPMLFMDAPDKFLGFDVGLSFNTEDGDFESSAARFPVRSYFIHKWNEQFLWIAGLSYTADKDNEWTPLIGFIYEPNEELSFNFVSNNPNIAYKPNEKWTLMLEGAIDSDEFEVDRNADENVILRYESYTAGVGVKHHFNEDTSAKLSIGRAFGRRFQYEDDQGKTVLDDATYVSLKLTTKF